MATRPLAINIIDGGIYFPTTDLTKNVCELVDAYGDIAATYDYAPFGAVSAGTPSGSSVPANPIQWSSEVYDSELDLVYYNYRHYSPSLGRFLSRDPIEEQGGLNLYVFLRNKLQNMIDLWGNWAWPWEDVECIIREETWSAIKLLEREGDELAETTGEIEVKHVSCNCVKGKWIFSSAKVYLYITVHTFPERYYERMKIPFAWVKRCEYDHVADMKAWAKGAGDEIVEQFSFSSQKNKVDCQHDAQNELQNKLFSSLKNAYDESKKNWDESGRHSYDSTNRRP